MSQKEDKNGDPDSKTLTSFSLKISEAQNSDNDIYSHFTQYGFQPNTSTNDYKFSQLQMLNKRKFEMSEYETALENGKIAYLKSCHKLHISACSKLISMLDANETNIELNHYRIGNGGSIALANMLGFNHKITSLKIRGNCLSAENTAYILKMVDKNRSLHLEKLDVSFNKLCDIGNTFSNQLKTTLSTTIDLQELNISNCSLKNIDLQLICHGLAENTNLRMIDLSRNHFKDSVLCASYISDALRENATLVNLDISRTSISDCGLKILMKGLKENTGLTTLSLAFCSISYRSLPIIAQLIREHEYMEDINLSSNNLGNDCNVILNESGNKDMKEGIKMLENAIHGTCVIKSINLENNSFHDEIKQILRTALENSSIKQYFV